MKNKRKYPALGILFKGVMVRAIHAGDKTQTRRTMKPQPVEVDECDGIALLFDSDADDAKEYLINEGPFKPKYQVGDILYVKETWCELVDHHVTPDQKYVYRADPMDADSEEIRQGYIKAGFPYQWKSSLFMPYEAARIFLKVTDVRVERLNDISEADAWAEGCKRGEPTANGGFFPAEIPAPDGNGLIGWDEPQDWYADLWEEINGEDSWDANPYVWVYTFERTEKPA